MGIFMLQGNNASDATQSLSKCSLSGESSFSNPLFEGDDDIEGAAEGLAQGLYIPTTAHLHRVDSRSAFRLVPLASIVSRY